jgi:hypothetical protein
MNQRSDNLKSFHSRAPLVIENFFTDPDKVRELTLANEFEEHFMPYPRYVTYSKISQEINSIVMERVSKEIGIKLTEIPVVAGVPTGSGVVTVKAQELKAHAVHTDLVDLTVIIYLSYFPQNLTRPELYGTKFLSNKAFGINQLVIPQSLESDIPVSPIPKRVDGKPDPENWQEVMTELASKRFDNASWEILKIVPYKFNTALLFSGHSFHSTAEYTWGKTVNDGRMLLLFSYKFQLT